MKSFVAGLLVTLIHAIVANDYNGYQVLRVTPASTEHRQWLRDIETSLGDVVDFWSDIKNIPGSTVDIMVPPSLTPHFRSILNNRGLPHQVMMSDVGETVARQRTVRLNRDVSAKDLSSFDYSVYHTYDEIQQWVNDVVAEYPGIATRFELPNKSYEGRTISGIKIAGTGGSPGMRKAVWWEGGIHAREWISPATVMFVTGNLLQNYTADVAEVVRMFDTLDWYIVPSLNVDGYAFTWAEDRLWRKTRSSNVDDTGSGCMGTDPNRNWPYKWAGEGTSAFPCSNVYHGIEPLSEQEVEGVVDYLRAKKSGGQDFVWFIDWHSYSQLVITPWSFSETEEDPVDLPDMLAAGQAMANAINDFAGKTYVVGPTAKILYAAAGASNDFGYAPYDPASKVQGGLGAKYSYVVELRDEGEYGFLLPEDQILETGGESFHGAIAMATYIMDTERL